MEAVREGELHPLQNSNILKLIFKNLKLADLKSCRLVCVEWCRGSSNAMKEMPSMARILDEDGKRISDFLELVRVDQEEIAYSVPSFFKDFQIRTLQGNPRKFGEICGDSIKSLDLRDVSFQASDDFRYAIFQACPNLEALSLDGVTVGGTNPMEPNEWIPPMYPPNQNTKYVEIARTNLGEVSWMQILGHFPAVEKFHILPEVTSSAGYFGSLVLARRHDDQCWKIKDLMFGMEWTDTSDNQLPVVPAFENLNLPLEKLTVFHIDRIVDVIALQRLLLVHAPMLTNLRLVGLQHTRSPVMQLFPLSNDAVFVNVTELVLVFASLPSVSFLQAFPNLKQLNLISVQPQRQFSNEPLGNWVISSCTKLCMVMQDFKTEDVRQLLSKLPNLDSLIVHAPKNDTFQVICELLPNLVHFICTQSQINDIGISGLDDEDVVRINEERRWWPISVARPNLTGLTNLQTFKMQGTGINLGYTTALCVRQLPHLQEFDLEGYGHLHEDLQIQFS